LIHTPYISPALCGAFLLSDPAGGARYRRAREGRPGSLKNKKLTPVSFAKKYFYLWSIFF